MVFKWFKYAALLALLVQAQTAGACSCGYADPAGFVHGKLDRLPANARGALFLPPPAAKPIAYYGSSGVIYDADPEAMDASWFSISSDAQPGPIPGELSWPDLSRGRAEPAAPRAYRFIQASDKAAFLALELDQRMAWPKLLASGQLVDISTALRSAERLVRIGPVGGFKSGVRYTISYLRKLRFGGPAAPVSFTIDSAPLDTAALHFALTAEGQPERKLLPMRTTDGSCGINAAATAQVVRYVVPDALAPYRDGIAYFSESATAAGGTQAAYADLDYSPSLCSQRAFGTTTLGDGREQLYGRCNVHGKGLTVRGWAGLLEVEDRLQPTPAISIALGQAPGAACSGLGILKEALASGDRQRIQDTACSLGRDGDLDGNLQGRKTPAAELPSAMDIVEFAKAGDSAGQLCAQQALARLNEEEAPGTKQATARLLGELARVSLKEGDAATLDKTISILSDQARLLRRATADVDALLLPALPALVDVFVSGKLSYPSTAGQLISQLRAKAGAHVEAIYAVAEGPAPLAPAAINTLVAISPGDPRLHALLLRNAEHPALLENAALGYARVADAAHRRQAVQLLIRAAEQKDENLGSTSAIDALARLGRDARDAIPMLLKRARQATPLYIRSRVYSALLAISEGEPDAIAVLAEALNAQAKDLPYFPLADLKNLGIHGRALLPAIELRMQRPLNAYDKDRIKAAILAMQLPEAQQQAVLARLASCQP